MRGEIRKFGTLDELSLAAAEDIASLIRDTVTEQGRFALALSGGNTPRTLHRLLAERYREDIPWNAVHIFFGDERYVPHDDKQSNYLMAKETLLDLVPIPAENIHPVPTGLPEYRKSADAYETELKKFFADDKQSFDLLLLGMGKEGHTASLFPHLKALDEKERWTAAVEVPAVPAKRITVTYPVLNRSSAVYFLISGEDKQDALEKVFDDASDFHLYPARGISPAAGRLVWWVAESAYPTRKGG